MVVLGKTLNVFFVKIIDYFLSLICIWNIDLDHTADVQCHAWGDTLIEAFEHMATCLMNYMTDLELVEIDPIETVIITVQGKEKKCILFCLFSDRISL
jgi:SHS2 domain-containing protein